MVGTLQWVVQGLTLAGLVGLLFYVRRKRENDEAERRVAACLNVVENRTESLERAAENYRLKMEDGLKRLNVICDKATTLFDRGFEFGGFSPSTEERELRSIVPDERVEIPSLKEVEQVRHRLREELKMDARSVLGDQLT